MSFDIMHTYMRVQSTFRCVLFGLALFRHLRLTQLVKSDDYKTIHPGAPDF